MRQSQGEAPHCQNTLMLIDPFLSPPRLMEVATVAHRLNTGEAFVRRLIKRGQLPAIRLGQQWRVDPVDLQTFIDAQRVVSDLFAGHQGRMGQSDRRSTPRPPDEVIALEDRVARKEAAIDQLFDAATLKVKKVG
jgi:excisionase family DNA binding protein